MSYDLYFKPPEHLPVAALKRHFESRRNTGVSNADADYDNPETGVHFQWWFGEPETGEDADDPLTGSQATLSVNFNRPSAFIHEAAREAEALARTFAMQMIDPQADGAAMPYDGDRFRADYLASAQRVTARLIQNAGGDKPRTLPRKQLSEIWAWNDRREAHENQTGDDLFLPRIMLLGRNGTVETAITWGDGVPMCCPRVDTVICLRRDTVPRTGFFRRKPQDLVEPMPFDTFLADFGDVFQASDRFGGTWTCQGSDQSTLRSRLKARSARSAIPLAAWKAQDSASILPFHAVLDEEFFV